MCVEIDLNQPVVGRVWLQGHWYKVEYEGLQRICSTCGCYGHFACECSMKPVVTDEKFHTPNHGGFDGVIKTKNAKPVSNIQVATKTNLGKSVEDMSKQSLNGSHVDDSLNGEWLMVRKKKWNNVGYQNKRGLALIDNKSKLKFDGRNKGKNTVVVYGAKIVDNEPKFEVGLSNSKEQGKNIVIDDNVYMR